jgi:hypothetical protein
VLPSLEIEANLEICCYCFSIPMDDFMEFLFELVFRLNDGRELLMVGVSRFAVEWRYVGRFSEDTLE